jgi:hypothetical protein
MSKSDAMALIRKVCADFKGSLNDHQTIQKALTVIQDIVFPPAKPKETEDKKK